MDCRTVFDVKILEGCRFFNTSFGPKDLRFLQKPILKHSSAVGSSTSGNVTSLGQFLMENSLREFNPKKDFSTPAKDSSSSQSLMNKALRP